MPSSAKTAVMVVPATSVETASRPLLTEPAVQAVPVRLADLPTLKVRTVAPSPFIMCNCSPSMANVAALCRAARNAASCAITSSGMQAIIVEPAWPMVRLSPSTV